MRRWTWGLAVALATAGPVLAETGTVTTGPLAELCGAASPTAQAYCRGFLIGAGQYHATITAPGGLDPLFCLPTPAPSVEQVQAGFAAWARANPQHANERAIEGVMRWAASAFPCVRPAAGTANRRSSR